MPMNCRRLCIILVVFVWSIAAAACASAQPADDSPAEHPPLRRSAVRLFRRLLHPFAVPNTVAARDDDEDEDEPAKSFALEAPTGPAYRATSVGLTRETSPTFQAGFGPVPADAKPPLIITTNQSFTYLEVDSVSSSAQTAEVDHSAGTVFAQSLEIGTASGGSGVYNQSGGLVHFDDVNPDYAGVYLGNVQGSTGTYNLNGGTLDEPFVQGGAGTSIFNFNGGTLRMVSDSGGFFNVTHAYVQAGGAIFNLVGTETYLGSPLVHDPSLGAAQDGGITVQGFGTLGLYVQNTYTGPTTLNGTRFTIATGGRVPLTSRITVNAGGTLLTWVNDAIGHQVPLTLNAASGPGSGATAAFDTGGNSETLGALTLSSTSVIDLEHGGVLHFASSSGNLWTGTLAIWDWDGTRITGGGANQLLFGSDITGLTPAQLSQIQFYSDDGRTYLGFGGYATSLDGEIVPVPEPATWLSGALLLGAAGIGVRKRCSRAGQTCPDAQR